MKTARNIFIVTLAVGDSTLCVLTMPMTLLGVLTKYWPFGTETEVLCTIVRTWPAINAFFSSYTMAVIAFDRHRFIVHSTKRQVRFVQQEQLFSSLGKLISWIVGLWNSTKGLQKLPEDGWDRQTNSLHIDFKSQYFGFLFLLLSGKWKRSCLDISRCVWLFLWRFNPLYHLYQIAKDVLWAWGVRSYRILCGRLISARSSIFSDKYFW